MRVDVVLSPAYMRECHVHVEVGCLALVVQVCAATRHVYRRIVYHSLLLLLELQLLRLLSRLLVEVE